MNLNYLEQFRMIARCENMAEAAEKFRDADGLVLGSPVYFSSPNGTLISFTDRLFFSAPFDKTMKVGAAITVARRGGNTASFDVMNKYFSVSGMPIATSQYWNMLHGREQGEAAEDKEGIYTVRQLARNMSFMIKAIALAKEKYGMPVSEERVMTNFVREDLAAE